MSNPSLHAQVSPIDRTDTVLTDGGRTRRFLELSGVRFDSGTIASRWWEAILEGVATSEVALRVEDDGAIVVDGRCARPEVASTLLARAVSSARMLRVLAPGFSPTTVEEEILAAAASFGLTVVPKAEMPSIFGGGRGVSARILGDRHRYVHALPSGTPLGMFDDAQSLFSSSIVGSKFQAVVLPDGFVFQALQKHILNARGRVLTRDELGPFLDDI